MKKTLDDLSVEERKEYEHLQAISVDIPFSICVSCGAMLVALGIIFNTESSVLIGIILLVFVLLGALFDQARIKKLFGL